MKIHEYQAKEILKDYGISVPQGRLATTAEEAMAAADELGGSVWVVKAQIHAGGRGNAGGVKVARSRDEVGEFAAGMLGKSIVTHQTGPEGSLIRKIYVEEGVDIDREFYLGLTLDREKRCLAVIGSAEGGTAIEEVAEENPDAIKKFWIDPSFGLLTYQPRLLAFALGLSVKEMRRFVDFSQRLYRLYVDLDASLAEINPLVITKAGEVIALDAKLNFDDNALFRQKNVLEYRDTDEEDPGEVEASQYDLSYIKLDGNIGCLVNGAGLAMGTMDTIKYYGGEPANFLDVGGGATAEKVTAAFEIILRDNVDAIFVNIFGGIMRCDTIAEGVIAAAKQVGLGDVPLIVRLAGTKVEEGKKMLAESGLPILAASDLAEGAKLAVEAAEKRKA